VPAIGWSQMQRVNLTVAAHRTAVLAGDPLR
jgi:hypothetical protein